MDGLKCDIASVISNGDFSVLHKLESQWSNFRTEITARVQGFTSNIHEYSEKKMLANNKIADLENDIKKLTTEIDNVQLQQKILVNKIDKARKNQEELVNEVDTVKAQRDSLFIEMDDLQQESEKRKEKKLLAWDAIKRACHTYNQHLGFHILLEEINEEDHVKVSFFLQNENRKNQYYACMTHHDNQWTVVEIHPKLKKEYLQQLRGGLLDTTFGNFKISDVTAFLCCLRSIFKKYYINEFE